MKLETIFQDDESSQGNYGIIFLNGSRFDHIEMTIWDHSTYHILFIFQYS